MEKHDGSDDVVSGDKVDNKEVIDNYHQDGPHDEEVGVVHKGGALKKDLKSRHMQMIAIGEFELASLLAL